MKLGRGLTLLLGGARSGKSDLAVKLGQAWAGSVLFVATATAGDADLAGRFSRHKQERPADWGLIEAPVFDATAAGAVAKDSLIIVDCVTLLVANLMFADRTEPEIVDHVDELASTLTRRQGPSLVISNEVGLGIHPETAMGRQYRDVLGRANRVIASLAQTSLFVAAGKVVPLTDLTIEW